VNNQSWEPETGEKILENFKKEIQRIKDLPMNYNEIGKYKRLMNLFEKLLTGWRQMFDNRWEWWYHLTETPEEMYFEFWMILNMDMVAYEEEIYYNGK
jgi:hypothetical protein